MLGVVTDLRYSDLPVVWQQRFAFFDAYGPPNSSPQAREAFRRLSFWDKQRLNVNIWAFLFSFLYFFVKGMWRKGLVLAAMAVAVGVLVEFVLHLSESSAVGASFAVPALAMTTANYAYYLHRVQRSTSWNPFEGFGRRRT